MRLRLFAVMAALLASASSAYAQMQLPRDVRIPVQLARVTGESFAQTAGARGTVNTAPDRAVAEVAGLSMFRVGYENGDHKFRKLTVIPGTNLVSFAFNDANEDDPFAAQARWINITGGRAGSISGGGGGTLQLVIPEPPANHTFVLRGFQFERRRLTDANVRSMSVRRLAGTPATIEVSLIDDERMDLRAGSGRTPGRSGPDTGRHYNVVVHYAWIPDVIVASRGQITGSERGREAASVPQGPAMIAGFDFRFGNADHHLLGVGVDLANGGSVVFQDNNTDDPVRWRVDYVALRAPG